MMPGYANALGVGPSILYPDDAFWRPFLAATGPVQAFEVAPIKTRSWWWLAEPIAVLAAFLVAH